MFAYLSRKIAIPGRHRLHCCDISFEPEGIIVCGGDDGLLRVISIDDDLKNQDNAMLHHQGNSNSDSNNKRLKNHHNHHNNVNVNRRRRNYSLSGHEGRLVKVSYNPTYRKIASADENGLIIVWSFCQCEGTSSDEFEWKEDMVQTSATGSSVNDLKWSNDGSRVCILYDDGRAIVGSVSGQKLWSKGEHGGSAVELSTQFQCLAWAPFGHGNSLLLASSDNGVHFYDEGGNDVKEIIRGVGGEKRKQEMGAIVDLQWELSESNTHSIAIAYFFGRVQIRSSLNADDHDDDDGGDHYSPLMIECDMEIKSCQWGQMKMAATSALGQDKLLAVCGLDRTTQTSMVKFYNGTDGKCIYCLNVSPSPVEVISRIMFNDRKLVAFSDSGVFFANLCLPVPFATVGDRSLVYVEGSNNTGTSAAGHSDKDNQILFQDWKRGLCFKNQLERGVKVVSMKGSKHLCLVVIKNVEEGTSATSHTSTSTDSQKYQMRLFDNVGTLVASKTIPLEPIHVTISQGDSPTCIVIADDDRVYVWIIGPYTPTITSKNWTHSLQHSGMERMFHASDDSKHPAKALADFNLKRRGRRTPVHARSSVPTERFNGFIQAIDVSSKVLIIAERESIDILSIPNLVRMNRVGLAHSPILKQIAINCDSTMFSAIDENNGFRVFEMAHSKHDMARVDEDGKWAVESGSSFPVHHNHVECIFQEDNKMAWSMKWASDEPTSCALMEKARVSIFERCYHGSCGQRKYQVGFASSPWGRLMDFFGDQIRVLLYEELQDGYYQQGHLECQAPVDIFETQYLKNARNYRFSDNPDEISYFLDSQHPGVLDTLAIRSVEEATDDWKDAKRSFIALKDFDGMQFIDRMSGIHDEKLRRDEIARFTSQRLERQSGVDGMRCESSDKIRLQELIETNVVSVVRNPKLLQEALDTFTSQTDFRVYIEKLGKVCLAMGMVSQAAKCYGKLNPQRAIDICIANNIWNDALYHAHKLGKAIEDEVKEKARVKGQLLKSEGKENLAGYVYNRSGLHTEGAQLWYEMGMKKRTKDPALAITLFVLAGRECLNHRVTLVQQTGDLPNKSKKTRHLSQAEKFEQLMNDENERTCKSSNSEATLAPFSNAWHEAAQLHFLLLAHRQFYEGEYESSMMTALKCVEYVTEEKSIQIYSLLALSSWKAGYLGTCSEAFRRLQVVNEETGDNDKNLEELKKLSLSIFKTQAPKNDKELSNTYVKCLETGKCHEACTISGRSIVGEKTTQCHICEHFMITRLMKDYQHCPLCLERIIPSSLCA